MSDEKAQLKIYIAGFDVFCEKAAETGKELKGLCAKYGFEGLYPLDNECDNARDIFKGNLELINRADIICANLNNFRGEEPDSGTAFEIGYGFAKGKMLFAYRDDVRTLRERLGEKDENGFLVEDFNLSVNLMLGCCCTLVKGGFEDCLKQISKNMADVMKNRCFFMDKLK